MKLNKSFLHYPSPHQLASTISSNTLKQCQKEIYTRMASVLRTKRLNEYSKKHHIPVSELKQDTTLALKVMDKLKSQYGERFIVEKGPKLTESQDGCSVLCHVNLDVLKPKPTILQLKAYRNYGDTVSYEDLAYWIHDDLYHEALNAIKEQPQNFVSLIVVDAPLENAALEYLQERAGRKLVVLQVDDDGNALKRYESTDTGLVYR